MTQPVQTEKIINISQFDSSSDCDSDQPPAVPQAEATQRSMPGGKVSGSFDPRKKSFPTFPGPRPQQRQRVKEVSGPSSFLSDPEMEAELQFCLRQLHCFEDTDRFRLRGEIIREIEELMKVWVREESQGLGRLVCYGSYKLSVIDSESDLDLLCVVPRGVTRNSFFTSFYQRLQNKVRSGV